MPLLIARRALRGMFSVVRESRSSMFLDAISRDATASRVFESSLVRPCTAYSRLRRILASRRATFKRCLS